MSLAGEFEEPHTILELALVRSLVLAEGFANAGLFPPPLRRPPVEVLGADPAVELVLIHRIAGVAIATALVPPLCSVGISLAYGHLLNAFGAAALFATNFVAIVLASSLTFWLMGVTSARSLARHRRTARLAAVGLVAVLLAFWIPLGRSLAVRTTTGSVRPLGYPVKRTVARAIQVRVQQEEGVELMFMARSSISGEVVVYVASDDDVSRKLAWSLVTPANSPESGSSVRHGERH